MELAKHYRLSVYPLWLYGDAWIECVPLAMVTAQYIDARDEKYDAGVSALTSKLSTLLSK